MNNVPYSQYNPGIIPTTYAPQYSGIPQRNYQTAVPYNPQPVVPQQPQYSYTPQQQSKSDIHWVQGQSGAKAYNVEPGCSVILMDSESNKFYIKSADQSGMPLPLRVFRYTEEAETVEDNRQSSMPDMSNYLTKEDFGKMLEEYLGPLNKENKK